MNDSSGWIPGVTPENLWAYFKLRSDPKALREVLAAVHEDSSASTDVPVIRCAGTTASLDDRPPKPVTLAWGGCGEGAFLGG